MATPNQKTTKSTKANLIQRAHALILLEQLTDTCLQTEFYGQAQLIITIEDGTIQTVTTNTIRKQR